MKYFNTMAIAMATLLLCADCNAASFGSRSYSSSARSFSSSRSSVSNSPRPSTTTIINRSSGSSGIGSGLLGGVIGYELGRNSAMPYGGGGYYSGFGPQAPYQQAPTPNVNVSIDCNAPNMATNPECNGEMAQVRANQQHTVLEEYNGEHDMLVGFICIICFMVLLGMVLAA